MALYWGELAMLWDVPIWFMELVDKTLEDLSILEHIIDSPPVKFLERGTAQLLTSSFQGG